jgi:hypothetical protein
MVDERLRSKFEIEGMWIEGMRIKTLLIILLFRAIDFFVVISLHIERLKI